MSLLNKKIIYLVFLVFTVIFYSCGKKKSAEKNENVKPEKTETVLQLTQKILGENTWFAVKGKFDGDTASESAAGMEVKGDKEWGIKFVLLKSSVGKFKQVYETALLNGSMRQSRTKKIELPGINYDMIYYNSEDYYLGSGGGEVYSYVINFKEDKIYYAHLISEPGNPASLYLSSNIDHPEIKSYFMENFNRDYPGIKLISKDITLKY